MPTAPANLPVLEPVDAAPKPLIGFIGQGFIGKNYADDFERRGYACVRYSLEPEYIGNKDAIKTCDIVFIAVPTPTTPQGFSSALVEEALMLVGIGKVAVIKSTILPGTTARLQRVFPAATILYSPEFLSEKTAAHDAAHPFSNIIGISGNTLLQHAAAKLVLSVLPQAPFESICSSTEAELIKYSHNLNGYWQILLSNTLYDAAQALNVRWEEVQSALMHDPMMSHRYLNPVHQSGHPGATPGRGAGGHCFIKDFAAFRELYGKVNPDDAAGLALLAALERKNIELLRESGKDTDLLEQVYGASLSVETPVRAPVPVAGSAAWIQYVLAAAGTVVVVLGLVDIALRLSGAILS